MNTLPRRDYDTIIHNALSLNDFELIVYIINSISNGKMSSNSDYLKYSLMHFENLESEISVM